MCLDILLLLLVFIPLSPKKISLAVLKENSTFMFNRFASPHKFSYLRSMAAASKSFTDSKSEGKELFPLIRLSY